MNLSEISQRIQTAFTKTKDWLKEKREELKIEKYELTATKADIKYGTEQIVSVLDSLRPLEGDKETSYQLRHIQGMSGLAVDGKNLTNAEALPYVLREATTKRLKDLERSQLLNHAYGTEQHEGRSR